MNAHNMDLTIFWSISSHMGDLLENDCLTTFLFLELKVLVTQTVHQILRLMMPNWIEALVKKF